MKTIKISGILPLLAICAVSVPSFCQQKVFNWLPANDESVRLDPANYHSGRTYRPGPNGGNIHVDIQAQQPVTIFLADAGEWSAAIQPPAAIGRLRQICLREHVVETTYVCEIAPEAMTLVIQDERDSPDHAIFTGLGSILDPNNGVVDPNSKVERAMGIGLETVLKGQASATRHFVSPNDAHIQYYHWDCVANCIQPEYQWIDQIKEKYELTSFLKVYGGFALERDGEQVSIKLKSPVPMVVAMVPSQMANQLPAKADMLEPALEMSACQQRGVQTLQFQCNFNLSDGPQSLIVVPESVAKVPHKKAEIEMMASKCVANCVTPEQKQ